MATVRMAGPDAVSLDHVAPDALGALFERERGAWRHVLGWDSPASAETLTRAIEWGIVRGAALVIAGRPLGYLLLQPGADETRLCGVHLPDDLAPAAVTLISRALAEVPAGSRLEGQLVAFDGQAALDAAFRHLGFAVEPRDFLELRALSGGHAAAPSRRHAAAPSRRHAAAAPSELARAMRIRELDPDDIDACADVLVAAHAGGVEARINQAFRTRSAATAYLREVIESGGCGRVRLEASSVLRWRGRIAGFCVATTTSPGVGHVPQIALDPAAQGQGLGSVLLARALDVLADDGCTRATLSVSRANARASAWYRRLGFRVIAPFASYHRDAPA